jgi:hypothetical protein
VASDLYALGIVLHELFSGSLPYPGELTLEARLLLVSVAQTFEVAGCGPALTELIEALKDLEPARRPTARQATACLRRMREGRPSGIGARFVSMFKAVLGRGRHNQPGASEGFPHET